LIAALIAFVLPANLSPASRALFILARDPRATLATLAHPGLYSAAGFAGSLNGSIATDFNLKLETLKTKTAPPNKKDGTVNDWLFLPSTVLTVSGSRGLLNIADLRLSIAD
jgi:hypothetical protein